MTLRLEKHMKYLYLILSFLLLVKLGISNPMMPPPKLLVSEIYFSDTSWVLELVGHRSIPSYYPDNLDSVKLITSSGESFFKPGIQIQDNEIILITKDQLSNPLEINRLGDFIEMHEKFDGELLWELRQEQEVRYGSFNKNCGVPEPDQSLVMQHISVWSWEIGSYYDLVIEDNPSLGAEPFKCNTRSTIKGRILDARKEPVKGAEIVHYFFWSDILEMIDSISPEPVSLITDKDGYFTGDLFAKTYYDRDVILHDSIIGEVSFKIKTDTLNIYTFQLEEYKNVSYIRHYPNPATYHLVFEVRLPQYKDLKNMVIKIFNPKGFVIDIIPVTYHHSVIDWSPQSEALSSGCYFYTLENDHKRLTTNKMIIAK